ncbi:MAG: radical SAM protein [Lachnospiraceae bacterium]|nr:radical SAM protein [Lachnospiraceae bacterium]
MKIPKRVLRYAEENFNEVVHTTLNPEGPGVVRIHLIPPKIINGEIGSSVAIINGQDIVPVGPSWTILLTEFIKEVNKYSGKEIAEGDYDTILNETVKSMKKVYPFIASKRFKNDIFVIMNTFKQIAYGEPVDEEIGYLSMGEYAPMMRAPHRMDLMVSAMTKEGVWHCNQKCIHCYAAGQKQAEESELSTQDWFTIIDKCKEVGIPQITFTGGEPTMRDDLVDLIEHSRWFVTRLNTNGIKLTSDLCKKLMDASLDSCQITFYSYDSEIHNKLVGANQYESTVKGIENALEAGINISINTPLCSLNKDYVKTLEFLHEKGVSFVTCSGLITTGNATLEASENLQLSEDEMKEILRAAVEYCYANGMEISFTSPGWVSDDFISELGINLPSCGACLSNMAITPGGNVVPCQSWLSDDVLGSMLTDKWSDIWESPMCSLRRDYSAKMLGECPLRRKNDEE